MFSVLSIGFDTHTSPSLRVAELGKGRASRGLIAHNPEDDKDSKECKDVNDKHTSFEGWKLAKENSVEDDGEQCRANRQQNAMPCRHGVVRIVEGDHALHCQSSTVASADECSLPAEDLDGD